jgi:alpha-tubulin suppressor-like RCC1 family protein
MNAFHRNQLFTWGAGEQGQLGQGSQRKSAGVPARVHAASGSAPLQISVSSGGHSMAVSGTAHAYACGDNEHGQLGKGDSTKRTTPRLVHALTSHVRVLKCAVGATHTLWLTDRGIFAAGANSNGQLGVGSSSGSSSDADSGDSSASMRSSRVPVPVAPMVMAMAGSDVFDVVCGVAVSAAVLLSGRVLTWGAARFGLLAHGDSATDLRTPTVVDVLLEERVKALVFGASHALALVAARDEYDFNRVLAWGDNMHGQLGLADNKARLLPRCVETLSHADIVQIAAGSYHSCAVNSAGQLFVWGSGHHGQLGLGRDAESVDVPRPLTNLFAKPVRRIACGALHTIVLCCDREPDPLGGDDGRRVGDTHVYTFGFNKQYQLGVGHNQNQQTPQRIAAFDGFIVQQVAAGGNTSAAIVRAPEPALAQSESLSLLVATWNVNASDCQQFGDWLRCDDPPDVVVVGLQEIIDLDIAHVGRATAGSAKQRAKEKAGAFRDKLRNLRRGGSTSGSTADADAETPDDGELDEALGATGQRWQAAVQAELVRLYGGDCAHYVPLASKRLVGVWMCVLVRAPLMARVTSVATATCAVGILNRLGNKGAAAVRFRIADTRFCFVCAHLAAGDDHDAFEKRCVDYGDICAALHFDEAVDADAVSIFDHDRLVWLGDLNFRLGGRLERDYVIAAVRSNKLATLLASDELLGAKERGRVFAAWHEQPITFGPTYKFDPGTDTYDTSSKARLPAWCDRVLTYGDGFEPHGYRRHELLDSDHRPVTAHYRCRVDVHAQQPPFVPPPSVARVPAAAALSVTPALPPKKVPAVPPKKVHSERIADLTRSDAAAISIAPAVDVDVDPRNWRLSLPVDASLLTTPETSHSQR